MKTYGLLFLISFLFFSCKKNESTTIVDDSPTVQELKGMVKTTTEFDSENEEIVSTWYYNSQKKVKKIVTYSNGGTSELIYKYFDNYILRYSGDSLGNIRCLSDSIFLNKNGMSVRWTSYNVFSNGQYEISMNWNYGFDENGYLTQESLTYVYRYDSCNSFSKFKISNGNTVSQSYFPEPCSIPLKSSNYIYSYYEDKENTLEYLYCGQPYRGRISKNPIKWIFRSILTPSNPVVEA